LPDKTNIRELSKTGMKLYQLEKNEARVSHMLDAQLKQLELMAEDIIPENAEKLAGTQVHLESLVSTIIHEYRAVKKEIFEVIENVMKNNKAEV
jgi:SMC interacting uncharacterized protein involved in chromosome segregation